MPPVIVGAVSWNGDDGYLEKNEKTKPVVPKPKSKAP